MWYAWLNMYVHTMHAQMHADILACAHSYMFFKVHAYSVWLKKGPKSSASPARYTSLHLRVSRSKWCGTQRWRLNGLQGWSAPRRQHRVVWHGLPLYLYQAASRCQDHNTEYIIIIHHISYIIIIIQKRHTKKTMQTQDQTQELHRRCVTSFSQEQGVQGKGNKLPIPLSSGRWHNSAHSAASRASKHWLGAWQSQCEKLIIRNCLWFMSLMSLQYFTMFISFFISNH